MKKQVVSLHMRTRIRDFVMMLAVMVAFFWLFSLAVRFFTDYTVSDFLPGHSDASEYYTGINTAIELGLFSRNAGYNGYIWEYDTLSVAPALFYGQHGLFMLVPYIAFGKIIGWSGAAPLVIHMILLAIAFSFVYLCTGSLKKTVAVQLLTFSFVPFLMFFHTMMMEVQMYAWAIVLTALTYAYMNRPNWRNRIGLMVAIVLASLMKITNVVFAVPYLTVALWQLWAGRKGPKEMRKQLWFNLCAGIVTMLAVGAAFIATQWFVAPWLSFHSTLAETWSSSPAEALRLLFAHAKQNVKRFFDPSEMPIFVALRYMVMGYALFLLANAFVKLEAGKLKARFHIQPLCLCLLLVSAALLNIMLFDVFDWRDFRILAPVFLSVVIYTMLEYEKPDTPPPPPGGGRGGGG
jgi:hypothetical protein